MALAQMTIGALLRPFDDDDDPLQMRRRRAPEKSAGGRWKSSKKAPKYGARKVRERVLEENVVQKGGASPKSNRLFLSHLFSNDRRFYSHGETSFPPLR